MRSGLDVYGLRIGAWQSVRYAQRGAAKQELFLLTTILPCDKMKSVK